MRGFPVLLIIAVAALLGVWPNEAEAQCGTVGPVCMTRTTLSANVAADDRTVSVTSGTGFTVGNGIWVDFEQMLITAVSTTTITVNRGVNGTRAEAHDSGDNIFTGVDDGGPRGGGHFNTQDPAVGQDCTRGDGEATHMPWINIRTGWMWVCDNGTTTVDWVSTRKTPATLNSEPTTF